MKRIILFAIIATFSISTLYAGNVSIEKAQRVGEKFMKESTSFRNRSVSSELVYTYSDAEGTPYIYIFNVSGAGFVAVSAEDRVKPILAYSTEGTFSAENIAPAFNFTIKDYTDDIQYIRENNVERLADISEEWIRVEKTGCVKATRNTRTVPILLETLWNQNYPYNSLCPEDEGGNGGHVYAGCVATAMAQVIKYYNYPAQGTGSHSYKPDSYPTQTANYGETFYNFERMPMQLDSTSTEEDIFYIAQLQWHCGIGVDMMYGPSGSGAYSDYVPDAASSYFGYSHDMELIYKDWYWGGNFSEMLKGELDLGHPLYYSGQDDSGAGGHAFVCDGYDENDYFHFNWGWDGKDNAWCAMGAVNTTKYAFNTWNAAIQGFVPADENYYKRPAKVVEMEVVENETDMEGDFSVTLNWTNPLTSINGEALNTIDSVIVKRDFETIAYFTTANPGESMTYINELEEDGNYEYSVLVYNEFGYSIPVYQRIMVGPKCDLVFEMFDEGGDGWKGGSISIARDGVRIAKITMEDGAQETRVVPMLQGNLTFIWNKAWFSGDYYTEDEISFNIYNANDELLYSSPDSLIIGRLFDYTNMCQDTTSVDETYHNSTNINVFPNPAKGQVTVYAKDMRQIKVYDIVGREVKSVLVKKDEMTVDVNDLDNGVYFISVETRNGLISKKIVINK